MSWSSAIKKGAGRQASVPSSISFLKPTIPQHVVDWVRLVSLDFESYFDTDYTLSKMSTSEYIRDPRFKAQMVGIKIGLGKTRIIPAARIRTELAKINWATHSVLCHNTQFDGFILSHHYGIHPVYLYDTLSMARGLHSNDIGAGLDEVSIFYGGQGKLEGLESTKGVLNWGKALYDATAVYCANDVDEMFRVFKEMLPKMPADEMDLIDLTCRMFCSPVLKVDIPRVEKELERELSKRQALMYAAVDPKRYDIGGDLYDKALHAKLLKGPAERAMVGVERDLQIIRRIVGSSEMFAGLLRAEGVEPPVKISPAWIKKPKDLRGDEGKWAYAFAKDDNKFLELPNQVDTWGMDANDPEDVKRMVAKQERLQSLVDVRIATKSSGNVAKAQRFLTAGADGMALPVGYAYYRAHCLTGDAQVLTRSGWNALESWAGGDIAQWSPDGSMKFAAATPNRFEVQEPMIHAKGRYHRCVYTKGHTLPTLTSYGTFGPRKAGEALTARFDIPLTGVLDGSASITNLEAQLAVMVQADGNVRSDPARGYCVRFGFTKARKIERCKALLENAGIKYTEQWEDNVCRIRVGVAHYVQLTKHVGPYKQFDKDFFDAPAGVKMAFISELAHWDGDVEPQPNGFTYMTTDRYNADFVATMAHLSGRAAFMSTKEREGWSDAYRVYIRRATKTRSLPKDYKEVPFSGQVYCPATQTGYFLVRQNGCIVVTGNTGRWGGQNKMNMQNLERPNYDKSGVPLPGTGELRQSIIAPKGHQIAVQDSGQIECRVNGWLWGQNDLMQAFRDADAGNGRDAYCNFGDSIYGREITKADKMERFVSKVAVLGLGFQMGAPKFQLTLAKGALGGPPVYFELDRCKAIVNTYRLKNWAIVAGWDICKRIIEDMAAGREGSHGPLNWEKETIWLPNGMALKYPDLRKSRNEETGWDEWSYQAKEQRKKIYGGLLCLGAKTQVLTDNGWKSIVSVRSNDKLWDGANWVSHSGLIYQGAKETINFGGVDMTPDHEVLVNDQWIAAEETTHHEATSSFARHHRASARHDGRETTVGQRRAQDPLASAMRLRSVESSRGFGVRQGQHEKLRMFDSAVPIRVTDFARHVQAPGLFSVAQHAGSLQTAYASILGTLRRARDHGVRGMERLRGVLVRHGADVQERVGPGPQGQFAGVQPTQLQVGNPPSQLTEPQVRSHSSDAGRPYAPVASSGDVRYREHDAAVPQTRRVASSQDVRYSRRQEQAVFDLADAGPLKRFTVRGDDGLPFVVHNCENIVQALARIIVAWQMLQISRKYRVVMTTHDEVVAMPKTAQADACLRFMAKWMSTAPEWCGTIPLNCEGGAAFNYSK